MYITRKTPLIKGVPGYQCFKPPTRINSGSGRFSSAAQSWAQGTPTLGWLALSGQLVGSFTAQFRNVLLRSCQPVHDKLNNYN
jgi:hypothetical protein